MQIRQIQVMSDNVQDRLVLRIATQASEEIRVFITRRFLRELWPHLVGMLLDHFNASPEFPQASPSAAKAPTEEGATFEKPYSNDNPTFPLGSQPLLASEATVEAAGSGTVRLLLREARERSFNLNLNAELLQALCSMLRASAAQAHWDLSLEYGKPMPEQHGGRPGLLH